MRSCYITRMKLSPDSDETVRVRWFFVADRRNVLGHPTVFVTRNWLPDKSKVFPLGERDVKPVWADGSRPAWVDQGQFHCDCWKDKEKAIRGGSINGELCKVPLWCKFKAGAKGKDQASVGDGSETRGVAMCSSRATVGLSMRASAVARSALVTKIPFGPLQADGVSQSFILPGGVWTNIANCIDDDGTTGFSSSGTQTKTLFYTWSAFPLPNNCELVGLQVDVKAKHAAGAAGATSALLFLANSALSGGRAGNSPWTSTLQYVSHGGDSDTWDMDSDQLDAFKVLDFTLLAAWSKANGVRIDVDACQLTIWVEVSY